VLPSEAFRGPSKDSSVLVQLIVRHLLLVNCSDLFYVCWVEIRELCDGSGLELIVVRRDTERTLNTSFLCAALVLRVAKLTPRARLHPRMI
jgi:hypothetical protein